MITLELLTPKKNGQYLFEDFSIRQAIEKMEFHRYATIPVLERKSGKYLYSISEGDFLWYLKKNNLTFNEINQIPLLSVPASREIKATSITIDVATLYNLSINQNYIPIVDDIGVFIGIITRKSIMQAIKNKI